MQEKGDICIKNFYIFNPTFGIHEGEEEKKIVLYYPPKTDAMTQMKTVGLSEAIIKFTQTFITKEECKSVHTLKTRQFFYQPEPNYWMILTINIPHSKFQNRVSDIVYHSENIHDEVYLSILKQAYDMYKLFLGPFRTLTEGDLGDTKNVKLKIQQFFNRYLHHMRIADCDIIDVFEGMMFLPLDKKTYLHAQSFMNMFQCKFGEQVHYSMLLMNNHLVWSNIDTVELRTIYRYLITNLLSAYVNKDFSKDFSGGNDEQREITFRSDMNLGKFLTCPPFYYSYDSTIAKVPQLFIKCGDKNIVYQLLVYHVRSSFICMFIPESVELSIDFLKEVELFLKFRLVGLAAEISLYREKARSSRRNTSSSGISSSYIYFNRLNLAQKNTLRDNKSHMTPEVLSVLTDICFDKKRNSPTSETVVKTYDDFWIIGRFCNEREFYVITQQKNTTLIEISEEMNMICDKQLKSVFFHV